MDYTNPEVRSKIYKERLSLDEFENDVLGKLNEVLIHKIGTTEVAKQTNAEQYTLDIFNNAYYVTTLILTTKRPELHLGAFLKISWTGTWGDEYPLKCHFGAITMGMVSLYMYLCKPFYWEQKGCVLRTQMEERHTAIYGDDKYDQMLDQFYGDRFFLMAKRDKYVADWFIEGKPLISPSDACKVFAPHLEASDRGSVSENEVVQNAMIEKLQKRIVELEELLQPVEGFNENQKVRIELARQLMMKAGMDDNILDKHGNKKKAAQVISTLLGIENNNKRGNKAQTCATFLSENKHELPQRYKKDVERLNTLLSELGIDILMEVRPK